MNDMWGWLDVGCGIDKLRRVKMDGYWWGYQMPLYVKASMRGAVPTIKKGPIRRFKQ
jgi:hypothetical protein